MNPSHCINPAEQIFRYLYIKDEPRPADLIVGFGHFDMEIPRLCGRLYESGFASCILFTGGIGAGTADLNQPEGQAFRDALRQEFPGIPDKHVLVESQSTNTSENVLFSEEVLRLEDEGFCFEKGIRTVLAVASPYRQRRVMLTLGRLYPDVRVVNVPPVSTLEEQRALFDTKGQELVPMLAGEVERLVRYAKLGYIREEKLPPHIEEAYRALRDSLAQ